MHTIHHRQPGCVCGLSAMCVCVHVRVCTCACGRVEYCWRAVALLAGVGFNWNTQWVVWVPVSQWKLHRQAHTDSLIWWATVSWGAADYKGIRNFKYPCITSSDWLCMCICARVCHIRLYLCTYLYMFCLLRICQTDYHCLHWYDKSTV